MRKLRGPGFFELALEARRFGEIFISVHSGKLVVSSTLHQLGSKHEELALIEQPLMVRLLSWEKKGCSLFGATMDERKLAIQRALNEVGKRVGVNDFPGVLALKKQRVTAKQLSDTLTDSDELVVGLVALNQKEKVWQGMALLEDITLKLLEPIADQAEADPNIPGQDVVVHQMPKGNVDSGSNIAMGGIPLFLTTGPGYGEAEVYHMLNIAYGSLKLTKHLPSFEGFQLDRIIVYPLLLHSLKNYSTLKWESPPTNISAAKKKETALKALLRRLQQDQFPGHGGYRVEAGLSGHGGPKEWLHQFMAWVNHRKCFEAKVQMKVISLDEYLASATNAVNQWGSMLNRDSRLQLSTGHPIVALGFSLESKPFQTMIDLVDGSHGDGPAEATIPDAPAAGCWRNSNFEAATPS